MNAETRTASYLKQSKLFRNVPDDVLEGLAAETFAVKAGEALIRQGDSGTDYFHLVSGRLRVFAELANGEREPLSEIYPGEGVGEMSMITNEARSATVIARLDSEVIRVTQAALLKLIERQPQLALEIARLVTARLASHQQQHHQAPKAHDRILAVLPLNAGADARGFAQGLCGSLCRFGKAEVLTGADSQKADFQNLREREKDLAFGVYVADSLDTEWARFCFLHADLVVLVANATEESPDGLIQLPFPAGADRSLFGRIHLVMVHPGEWQRDCRTAPWIARIGPEEYHHVRAGNEKDFARLARILSGRAVNLVLSGGGARAFAELGVLKAFREAGIAFDRVAGSSMGAFVAACYAYDGDFEDMIVRIGEGLLKFKPDRDFTLPMLSVLRGKRLEEFGASICGGWRIEDLPLRYFCLSSCLDDGEVVTHFDGDLMLALRASCAFPVLGPPLLMDGKLLIDGGVLNNLPIDVMKKHFAGKVTAIDISSFQRLEMDKRWDRTCPSGFDILWSKMKPFAAPVRVPSIVEILARVLDLACRSQVQRTRQQADWLIEPPVADCNLTDFHKFDRVVETGYQYGRKLAANNLLA